MRKYLIKILNTANTLYVSLIPALLGVACVRGVRLIKGLGLTPSSSHFVADTTGQLLLRKKKKKKLWRALSLYSLMNEYREKYCEIFGPHARTLSPLFQVPPQSLYSLRMHRLVFWVKIF